MDETTNILEEHWKRRNVKYTRINDTLKWQKTLRGVRCAMCGKSSHERKLDQAFSGWGVILPYASEEGKMPEACPKCMRRISPKQIPVPRIAVCAGCGTTQREKIYGLGFPGWQTIRFPAQGIMAGAVRITDLWCPDCSIKLARGLGPEFVRGSWTVQSFAANSLLTSTMMNNLYTNVTEAAYPHDNLLKNGSFESWSAGAAAAPDGWTLAGGGATIVRTATVIRFGEYAVWLGRVGNDCYLQHDAIVTIDADTETYWRGRTVTLGCWVYCTVAGRARLRVLDGVDDTYSTYHTGVAGWEFLTVTHTLNGAATGLDVRLGVDTVNATAYFDGAILVESEHVEVFTPHHNDEYLKAVDYQDSTPANFDYGLLRMECGRARLVFRNATYLSASITFGTAFSTLLTIVTGINALTMNGFVATDMDFTQFDQVAITGFRFELRDDGGGFLAGDFLDYGYWIAIGI